MSVSKEHKAAYDKQRYQDNKVEIVARAKQYYQDNKVEVTARQKQYRQGNKVEIAARRRQYTQDNRVEITAKAVDKYHNDPNYRVAQRLRSAVSRAKTFGFAKNPTSSSTRTAVEYVGKFDEEGWHCRSCGLDMSFEESTIDHIHPTSKEGSNELDNLQPMCQPCNAAKGDGV
jgi:5-methylcytosine-specific restriction endonuclease McrA